MAFDAVEQGGLAQGGPAALAEGELSFTGITGVALVAHGARHVDALEGGVVADALEKGDAEAGAGAGGGAEHAVGGALRHAVGEGFEALADGDDEGAREGRAVDPVPREVLRLQASVRAGLQEVGRQHGVLVGADALGLGRAEGGAVGVFDDFELVLLVPVEEGVEGGAGEEEGFGDEGGEGEGEGRHLVDVGFVDWAEGGEEGWVGPLVWGAEVVVEGIGGGAEWVRG